MEQDIKIIVIKSKHNKALIGFSSTPEQFILNWLKQRNQYTNLQRISNTHFTIDYGENTVETHHFYITSITDNETCWVSLNDNCMGFNDWH